MKVETWLFAAGVGFFTPLAIVYGLVTEWKEPVGVVALFLTTGLALLVGVYLYFTSRRIDARPEDDPIGEIAQGSGELGEFAPFSWWPLPLAFSAAVIFMGLAVGWWMVYIGIGIGTIALVGWVYEFYRGEHAH